TEGRDGLPYSGGDLHPLPGLQAKAQTSARPGGRPREQIAPTGRGCCSRMRGEGVPAPRRFDHGDMTIVEISAELAVRIGEHFGAFAYDPLEVVKTPRNLPFGLRVVQAEQDRVCAG